MRVVMVVAHPNPASFTHAVAASARRALESAGHDVAVLDLYEMGFDPVMSADDLASYMAHTPRLDDHGTRSAELVGTAEALVFVYPTWWSGVPAMLKGWMDKVLVEGVAFVFDRNHRVQPNLRNVRRLVVISTFGSPWPYVKLVNDNGRRTLLRALRLSTGAQARPIRLAMYAVDRSSPAQRAAFLDKVSTRMARL
jgi:NAD(P)H dehydrogenase (quinone)